MISSKRPRAEVPHRVAFGRQLHLSEDLCHHGSPGRHVLPPAFSGLHAYSDLGTVGRWCWVKHTGDIQTSQHISAVCRGIA